ncbi:hypothetical protein BJV82DRAFT_365843 [Fennellomyces sp. T-0311]|nr:hypothetical protein BJV82DRAFT_365843 [Fennellomyces sp. T-0311]
MFGREAQMDSEKLHNDFWSCLRQFPDKKGEKKDCERPWYRLLAPTIFTILLSNFVASWYATFSGQDAFDMQEEHPELFVVFFVFAVVVLTAVINGAGYLLQLGYVLTYGKGKYVPGEWRRLMEYPAMATSMDNMWNYRWHQLFRSTWLGFPFRPVLKLASTSNDKRKSRSAVALASLSVFAISGLMHEYLVFCGCGWDVYRKRFLGQEFLFFTLHGAAVILERAIRPYLRIQDGFVANALKRIWVVWFAYRTFPLFLNGFAYWGLWHANPFNMFTPYFLDNVWRKYPLLHQFCGSLL